MNYHKKSCSQLVYKKKCVEAYNETGFQNKHKLATSCHLCELLNCYYTNTMKTLKMSQCVHIAHRTF